MVLAKVIYDINTDSSVIRVKRMKPCAEVLALSHRWERLPNRTEFTVLVDGEGEYKAKLTPKEVKSLKALQSISKLLWVDYVCICQGDQNPEDKSAQVSIMGSLYLECTTCIVGPELDPKVPPHPSYWKRAWCVQEKTFGKMTFQWPTKDLDSATRRKVGEALVGPIAYAEALVEKLNTKYDSSEDWRVGNIRKAASSIPEARAALEEAVSAMVKNNQVALCDAALKIRQQVELRSLNSYAKWQWNMFNVECTHAKDALFGIWGVPMAAIKNATLNYDDAMESWLSVAETFPEAAFAYTPAEQRKIKQVNSTSVNKRIGQLLGYPGGTEMVKAVVFKSRWAHCNMVVTCNDDGDVGFGPYDDPSLSKPVGVCLTMRKSLIQPDGRRDLDYIDKKGHIREIIPWAFGTLRSDKTIKAEPHEWQAEFEFQKEVIPIMWKLLDGTASGMERVEAM